MGTRGFTWVHLGLHGYAWVCMGMHRFAWVRVCMGMQGFASRVTFCQTLCAQTFNEEAGTSASDSEQWEHGARYGMR